MSDFYQRPKQKIKIELTPLIDIIFILLIFFAVSSSIIPTQKGLNLQLPIAETSSKEKPDIILAINQEKTLILNQLPTPISAIPHSIQRLLEKDPSLQIILKADIQTPYQLIIQALDAIRLGGCFDIVLETQPVFSAS